MSFGEVRFTAFKDLAAADSQLVVDPLHTKGIL